MWGFGLMCTSLTTMLGIIVVLLLARIRRNEEEIRWLRQEVVSAINRVNNCLDAIRNSVQSTKLFTANNFVKKADCDKVHDHDS